MTVTKNNSLLVITFFFENVDRGGELEKHLVLFYKAVRTGIPTNSQQKVDRCDEW